jgi:predicted SprT family Zn-dependent metalloprotease
VLAFGVVPEDFALTDDTNTTLHRWLRTWNTPDLATKTRIELSPRLTRSLGRCYPERRLIRIAAYVAQSKNGLLHEVLCHELAHLAARELHGPRIRPHGPEWKALMRAAGFEPKTKLPAPPGAPRHPGRKARPLYLYVHRCPVCQLSRRAKRLMSRWRCAACIDAGLPGKLVITRTPR